MPDPTRIERDLYLDLWADGELTAGIPDSRPAEIARYALQCREALQACIPWVASNARGHAQEALAIACRLVGYDPYDWTSYPDTLTRRIELLDGEGAEE